jgi:hypothetical protein
LKGSWRGYLKISKGNSGTVDSSSRMEISGKSIILSQRVKGDEIPLATARYSTDIVMINVMLISPRLVSVSIDHTLRSRMKGQLSCPFLEPKREG